MLAVLNKQQNKPLFNQSFLNTHVKSASIALSEQSYEALNSDRLNNAAVLIIAKVLFDGNIEFAKAVTGEDSNMQDLDVNDAAISSIVTQGKKISRTLSRAFTKELKKERKSASLFARLAQKKADNGCMALQKHEGLNKGIVLPLLAQNLLYQWFIEDDGRKSSSADYYYFKEHKNYYEIMESFEQSSMISFTRDQDIAEAIIKAVKLSSHKGDKNGV